MFFDTQSLCMSLLGAIDQPTEKIDGRKNIKIKPKQEEKLEAKATDYRDGLIEQYKVEIAELKKRLDQKGVANIAEGIPSESLKESVKDLYVCDSTETLASKPESVLQLPDSQELQAMAFKIQLQQLAMNRNNAKLEILGKQLERINTSIGMVKKLKKKESKAMLENFIELLKFYFNDAKQIKDLRFHYGHAKIVETIGVPDHQKCRSLLRKCFRWDKRRKEWMMKYRVKNACRKVMGIVEKLTPEIKLNIMDAFKIYINWKYEFYSKNFKSIDMNTTNEQSPCTIDYLHKLLESTYKLQVEWYLKMGNRRNNQCSSHSLIGQINEQSKYKKTDTMSAKNRLKQVSEVNSTIDFDSNRKNGISMDRYIVWNPVDRIQLLEKCDTIKNTERKIKNPFQNGHTFATNCYVKNNDKNQKLNKAETELAENKNKKRKYHYINGQSLDGQKMKKNPRVRKNIMEPNVSQYFQHNVEHYHRNQLSISSSTEYDKSIDEVRIEGYSSKNSRHSTRGDGLLGDDSEIFYDAMEFFQEENERF